MRILCLIRKAFLLRLSRSSVTEEWLSSEKAFFQKIVRPFASRGESVLYTVSLHKPQGETKPDSGALMNERNYS